MFSDFGAGHKNWNICHMVLNFCCSCEILRKRQAYRRQGKTKTKFCLQWKLTREGHLYCTQIPSLGKKPTKQQIKPNTNKTTQNESS